VVAVSCSSCHDPEFARKREDPNHRVVRGFVGQIVSSGTCTRVNVGVGISIEKDLFECVEDEDGWLSEVRNVRNGAVLNFTQRPQLDYLAEYGPKSVILDTRNHYAFWVDDGVLVGFASMTREDIARFNVAEYHKPGVFLDLWEFQNVSLGPTAPPPRKSKLSMNPKSIVLLILIPLIGAFGVALLVAGYFGFITGGDKPQNIFLANMCPWILEKDPNVWQFFGFGVVGAILLLLVCLLVWMV
jgi:hypothetical protein